MDVVKRQPTSLPPDFLLWVPQNGRDADCVVASMGSIFGLTRDESLLVCGAVKPSVLAEGMTDDEITAAVKLAGRKGRITRSFDLTEDTGVLFVRKGRKYHACVLWAGRIIEGNGQHWLDPHDYLAATGQKVDALLVRVD